MKNQLLISIQIIVLCYTMISCSKSEDEPILISLSQDKIEMYPNNESYLEVSGADIYDCNLSVEDDFITTVHKSNGSVRVIAEKVGETEICVSYKGSEAKCTVIIKPTIDDFGNPYLAFGASKKDVKSKVQGQIRKETAEMIEFEVDQSLYETYYFCNDILECVSTFASMRYYDHNHVISHSRLMLSDKNLDADLFLHIRKGVLG